MLCFITSGRLIGKSSLCGIHLKYVVWFDPVHWQRYVLWFFVILYLSLVSLNLCFIIACIGNLCGLFVILGGGWFIWAGCGIVGCIGFSTILGCRSLLFVMYCSLSVQFCVWLGHGMGQFSLQFV